MSEKKEGLVVHLGSKPGRRGIYMRTAREVGRTLALMKIPVIYGGSIDGCMGALAEGCLENDGEIIGIMPQYGEWEDERMHMHLTELIKPKSMSERKQIMTVRSFGAIALPGAWGTCDEIFEYLTSTQLKHVMSDDDYPIRKYRPLGLLNVDNFYTGLINWIDEKPLGEEFLEKETRKGLHHSDNIVELIEMIKNDAGIYTAVIP